MQAVIDTLGWPVEVRILGVNGQGLEHGNAAACEGKDIPWLQETAQQPVWATWDVVYRDVIILDEDNVRIGTYNLTDHDLNDAENFQALKVMLQAAAGGR